ncbi:MAG: TatD family hydrolase [Oscillospiraceae bacterium]|nr:TatD family hydrolase [Oscillospiraceae bacterium]
MYFDSHAHLDDRAFETDREELFADLPNHGVGLIMNVGCDLSSSLRSIALAHKYPFVYAAVGSHPDDAASVNDELLALYRQLCADEKVKAIGEIGLDYHYEDPPREVQLPAFRAQLELAAELDLPVIVHEREAHADGMELIRQFPGVTGVFHCYSGAVEQARELVKRGWYIGFTGVVTFKNARKAVEVVRDLPLDRILIETDCPYMAPEPHRGRRNDSRWVPLVAAKIAELRGLTPEEVAAATTENAKRLFRIP